MVLAKTAAGRATTERRRGQLKAVSMAETGPPDRLTTGGFRVARSCLFWCGGTRPEHDAVGTESGAPLHTPADLIRPLEAPTDLLGEVCVADMTCPLSKLRYLSTCGLQE